MSEPLRVPSGKRSRHRESFAFSPISELSGEQDMVDDRDNRIGLGTYLTPQEAQAFHKHFVGGFLGFVGISVFAHFLVWSWRPWF
ncbi:MAG: light-harvesting antenna LH1, beta subunit [Sandaracinobacter sp.]